ncbi:MAG: MoaD/ThiS family protein [Chloroflexi bacterium]|nr:MoaD/ThiS family protein [Chloroflexota bacterium]
MRITIKFFALYREITGENDITIEAQKGSTVASLSKELSKKFPGFPSNPSMVAVNSEFVESDYKIKNGDEMAFLPPFSGG